MLKTRAIQLSVIMLLLAAVVAPAQAQIAACGDLIMPVVQLREIGRGMSRYHAGIDLMAPYGSPVVAAAAGTVVYAGRYYAYGYIIDLNHDDGSVTRYAHLSRFAPQVRPGAHVVAGQEIGSIGTSGNAHGAHLHFEVRYSGRPVDPKPFLQLANCSGPRPVAPLREVRFPVATPVSSSEFVDSRPGGIYE